MDANSIDADPGFKSATDEHLLPTSPCIGAGAPYPGILTDIDGDQRSASMPCIGADEYVLAWTEMAPLPGLVWSGGWLAHKHPQRPHPQRALRSPETTSAAVPPPGEPDLGAIDDSLRRK